MSLATSGKWKAEKKFEGREKRPFSVVGPAEQADVSTNGDCWR